MNLLALRAAAALAALSTVPRGDIPYDEVDLVEINHYYDDDARHVFDQLIFYNWCSHQQRYQVRDWRLIRNASQLPARNWGAGGYDMLWTDGEILRRVHARALRETWTQHDPEMRERDYLPKQRRQELVTPQYGTTRALP